MAAYEVEVQAGAKRDVARLSLALRERLLAAVEALGATPRPVGAEKLSGIDAYRVPVGDYRVIYEVDDEGRILTVTRVRHRREVYRRLR